jgi:hypothetical protein
MRAAILAVTLLAAPHAPKDNSLQVDLGVASAVGFLGVSCLRMLGERVEVETGIGVGLTGAQLSFMPKLTLGSGENHLVLGAGPSLALGIGGSDPLPWLNAEAGFEHRVRLRVLTQATVPGISFILRSV